jgi:hypothetical protein
MQTCVWPQDSAPHEARSGVDVDVHVVMDAGEACIFVREVCGNSQYLMRHRGLCTMRAASSSEPAHMREGLSGWYVTIDPPACHACNGPW